MSEIDFKVANGCMPLKSYVGISPIQLLVVLEPTKGFPNREAGKPFLQPQTFSRKEMQMQNTSILAINEPPHMRERFLKVQAEYRSKGVTTPVEWPMNTPEGRESYRRSKEREQFLERMNGMGELIARAEARRTSIRHGEVIDMNDLLYGRIQ